MPIEGEPETSLTAQLKPWHDSRAREIHCALKYMYYHLYRVRLCSCPLISSSSSVCVIAVHPRPSGRHRHQVVPSYVLVFVTSLCVPAPRVVVVVVGALYPRSSSLSLPFASPVLSRHATSLFVSPWLLTRGRKHGGGAGGTPCASFCVVLLVHEGVGRGARVGMRRAPSCCRPSRCVGVGCQCQHEGVWGEGTGRRRRGG